LQPCWLLWFLTRRYCVLLFVSLSLSPCYPNLTYFTVQFATHNYLYGIISSTWELVAPVRLIIRVGNRRLIRCFTGV
jgi:hypothetical protein